MAGITPSEAGEFYGNGNPKEDEGGNRICPHGLIAETGRYRSSSCGDCEIARDVQREADRERRRQRSEMRARARAEGYRWVAAGVEHGSVNAATQAKCGCHPCTTLRTYIRKYRAKGFTTSEAVEQRRHAELALAKAQLEYERHRSEDAARLVVERRAELRALDVLMRQAPGASGSLHSGRGSVRNPIKGRVL